MAPMGSLVLRELVALDPRGGNQQCRAASAPGGSTLFCAWPHVSVHTHGHVAIAVSHTLEHTCAESRPELRKWLIQYFEASIAF